MTAMEGLRLDLDRSSRHDLAHVKRLLERLHGDLEFRERAREAPSDRATLVETAGVDLSPADLKPFWDLLDAERGTAEARGAASDALRTHPLGALWQTWNREQLEWHRTAAAEWVPDGDRRLTAWRRRRLVRARSESLAETEGNIFPLLAFELSKGCSTQCWFCAWDPPKLEGTFPYTPENRRLWRGLLGAAWDLFGPGARTAICYHATEPTDNPDYFSFVADVRELYGIRPHTTTARPLKDLAFTRELLRLQDVPPPSFDRFSVLTLASLLKIHQVFSAEELLNVNFVLQNREALSTKVRSGRTLENEERLVAEARLVRDELPLTIRPLGTIECTCGYLVNLVDRSIRLVSPCHASKRWPFGYVVHLEGTFQNASEFREFVLRSIEECMREHLEEGERLAFREDLAYERRSGGFVVRSPFREHGVNGGPGVTLLGELVAEGTLTTGQITERMIQDGMPALEVVSWLDRLHQGGLLADAEVLQAKAR